MKVLFVYQYEYIEPIGIMSLSAFIKEKGHHCYFLDLAFEKDYLESIRQIQPDIIAYSITTGKHTFYQKFNMSLKREFQFFSIFGGPHATFFPDFIKEEGVDAICRGEGEYPLLELIEALGRGLAPKDIDNLWVKHNGKIYQNELRPLIENLDSLPFVDRDLVNKYEPYRIIHRRMVLTGRGCPYKCSYCFNHAYNALYKGKGRIIRRRSVDHVLRELKQIISLHSPKRFQFIDDTFIMNKEWCDEFCKRYAVEIKLPFIAYARVNLVTENIVKSLKDAGCITMLYAIESGNDHIRNDILKRNIQKEEIINASILFKKYNLKTYSQNMIALPDEDIAKAFETIDLNILCKPDYAWCSIFQPYPSTDLWAYVKEQGQLTDEEIDESYYTKSILDTPESMEMVNLHHLFSITVNFPFLKPLVKMLIKLPLNKLYMVVWHIHRLYCYIFKVKWIDFSELLYPLKQKLALTKNLKHRAFQNKIK